MFVEIMQFSWSFFKGSVRLIVQIHLKFFLETSALLINDPGSCTVTQCRLLSCIFCFPLHFSLIARYRSVFNHFAIPFLCSLNCSYFRYGVLFFALFIDRRIVFIFNLAALELSTAITVFFLLVIQTIT